MRVYLDNAATTRLDAEVFEAMKPYLLEHFGNPSSTHAYGREARAAVESARKKIAELLMCTPGEIIFTSGGTEADNTILQRAISTYHLEHIVTSPIEHHAVEHTLRKISEQQNIPVQLVKLDDRGHVDISDLHRLLRQFPNALVSLMHANNEIGNLLPIEDVGELCRQYNTYFHSDTVQTVGHYPLNLQKLYVHAIAGAGHKFHAPKGIGFMFIRKDKKLDPLILGGTQERNMRGGTENVAGIVGLAKALEICYREMKEHHAYIFSLKKRMIEKLRACIPGVSFNGDSDSEHGSLYTVLNVCLPEGDENSLLLFNLDLRGVSASGGSACSSGALTGSHVLSTLYPGSVKPAVRFSFSKYNTAEEIDYAANALAACCKIEA